VKTYGKAVPDIRKGDTENVFPRFETYRENIEGNYWFPTYTHADDVLHFRSGDVRILMTVHYSDYKRFRVSIKLLNTEPATAPSQPRPRRKLSPSTESDTPIHLNSEIEMHCFALTRLSFSWKKETPRRTKQCTGKLPMGAGRKWNCARLKRAVVRAHQHRRAAWKPEFRKTEHAGVGWER